MKTIIKAITLLFGLFSFTSLIAAPDWSREAKVPLGETRLDIYQYGESLPEVKVRE